MLTIAPLSSCKWHLTTRQPLILSETALCEYIQRRKQLKVLDLFGTINYDKGYDYKQQRQQT